jgi:hypothetical protein
MNTNTQKTHLPKDSKATQKQALVTQIKTGRKGLHFTPEQTDKHILLWEDQVLEASIKVQDILPQYEKAREEFLAIEKLLNSANQIKAQAEGILNMYRDYRNGELQDKTAPTLRTTSHTDKKPKTQIDWLGIAKEALKHAGRFLTFNELVDQMAKVDNSAKVYFVDQKTAYHRSYGNAQIKDLQNRINKIAAIEGDSYKAGRRTIVKTFVKWNGTKIGLREWLDADGKPLDKYSDRLLFKNDTRIVSIKAS